MLSKRPSKPFLLILNVKKLDADQSFENSLPVSSVSRLYKLHPISRYVVSCRTFIKDVAAKPEIELSYFALQVGTEL